mgnify:CR=1 FL=1
MELMDREACYRAFQSHDTRFDGRIFVGVTSTGIYCRPICPARPPKFENCRFFDTRTAHHIKSRARDNVIADNRIDDGDNGTSSYLIDIPWGGRTEIRGNWMRKGQNSSNKEVAISIGEEGVKNETPDIVVQDNVFINGLTEQTSFVRNSTGAQAILERNKLSGRIVPLLNTGLSNETASPNR